MRHRTEKAAVLACLALASCGPTNVDPIDKNTRNRIAVCSAGIGLDLSSELQAELSEFSLGGTLSAKTRQQIRGTIFNDTSISDIERSAAFDAYLACIRQQTQLDHYIETLESRRQVVLRELLVGGLPNSEVESIADLTSRHITATRTGNYVLASDLYRQITLAISEAQRERPNLDQAGDLLYSPS